MGWDGMGLDLRIWEKFKKFIWAMFLFYEYKISLAVQKKYSNSFPSSPYLPLSEKILGILKCFLSIVSAFFCRYPFLPLPIPTFPPPSQPPEFTVSAPSASAYTHPAAQHAT